jgi:hypothetical protein
MNQQGDVESVRRLPAGCSSRTRYEFYDRLKNRYLGVEGWNRILVSLLIYRTTFISEGEWGSTTLPPFMLVPIVLWKPVERLYLSGWKLQNSYHTNGDKLITCEYK